MEVHYFPFLVNLSPEVSFNGLLQILKEVATICFHLPFIMVLPYTTLHMIILPILIMH
jgi:hypothetical protein